MAKVYSNESNSTSLKLSNLSLSLTPATESSLDSSLSSSPRKNLGILEKSPNSSESSHEPKAKRFSGGLEQEMHGEASGLGNRRAKGRVFHPDTYQDNQFCLDETSPWTMYFERWNAASLRIIILKFAKGEKKQAPWPGTEGGQGSGRCFEQASGVLQRTVQGDDRNSGTMQRSTWGISRQVFYVGGKNLYPRGE